jgi:hypothetical protein
VFENRVLRRIFGPKMDELREDGENCITKSFMMYSLPSIIRMVKSRKMRWAWHIG